MAIKLLTDTEEEKKPTDAFEKLGKTIEDVIVGTNPRYAIGLYGDWGTGKTTLMKLIQRRLSKYNDAKTKKPRISTVWFNAWRYEFENEKATVPLILTILEGLVSVDNNDNDLKTKLEKFLKGWSLNLSLPIAFGTIDLSRDDKKNKDDYNIPKPSIQEGIDLIYSYFKKANQKPENKLKLVVFIDDLDRCSSEKTLEVLESMKILLDIPGIVYVIGVNESVLEQRIQERNKENNTNDADYIQKIIQVQTNVPDWEYGNFELLVSENIKENLEVKYFEIVNKRKKLLYMATKGNPRQLKRIINNFILHHECYGKNTEPEILLIVILMRHTWYKEYERFSTNEKFRIRIKELGDMESIERTKEIDKLYKNKPERKVESDDEIILEIKESFWEFYKLVHDELYKIENWSEYRNVVQHIKDDENSNDPFAILSKGNDLYNTGKYQEAIERYDEAIRIKPDYVNAIDNKGVALNNLGKYQEAIECHDEAIRIKPDYVNAIDNKGVALNKLGKYQEAIECYDEAIRIKPDDVSAIYNKSCVYSLMNKIDLALEFLDKAISLDIKYKELAKTDSDFDHMKNNPNFLKLIE